MKIRNSSRVVAIVLALMMIVPLISVPTFAEGSAKVLYSQDFESVTDIGTAVKSNNSNNISNTLANAGGAYGNVLYYDIAAGLTNAKYGSDSSDTLYLAPNNNTIGTRKVTSYQKDEETGLYSGTITIGETALVFKDTVLNTNSAATKANVYLASDETTAYDTTLYLINAAVACSWGGSNTIASRQNLQYSNIATSSQVVTYSADYYFDAGFKGDTENYLAGFGNLLCMTATADATVTVSCHGDNKTKITEGAATTVNKNTWFNVSIVVDYKEGTYSIYLNGEFVLTVDYAADKSHSGTINDNGWNLLQIKRGYAVSANQGFIMIDNATIYEGAVVPAAADAAYTYVETFDSGKAGQSLNNYLTTAGRENFAGIVSGSKYGRDGMVLEVGFDTLTTDKTAAGTPINGNGYINNRAFDYKTDKYVSISHDLYFPTGTVTQLELQIHPFKNNGASTNWGSLWQIYARKDGTITVGNPTKANYKTYNTTMARDQWNTIQSIINLETGVIHQYINGELSAIFNWSTYTRLGFDAGKMIAVKVNDTNSTTFTSDGGYVGWVAFDNITVTNMPSTPNNVIDFDNYSDPKIAGGYVNGSNVNIAPGTDYGKDASDKVLAVTLGETAINGTTAPINVNGMIANRPYSYETDQMMVIQEDIYIATDAVIQLQSQLYGVTSANYTSTKYWASLWKILAKADGSITLTNEDGWGQNIVQHQTSLARNTWNTLTTAINLVNGHICIYVNGVLYYEFDSILGGNIVVPQNQVIVAKLNSISNGFSSYKGTYAFDNIGVYSSLEAALANRSNEIYDDGITPYFNIDFENATVGAAAGGPSSAKYVDFNGNKVVQIDMRVESDTEETLNSWTGTNTDKMFKVNNTAFNFNTMLPERNIAHVVYSADYYIAEGAVGDMESQIHHNAYYALYQFNFNNSVFKAGGMEISFTKNAWHNVSMVVTATETNTIFDIYFDGVYAGTRTYISNIIPAASWSVAKVMKRGAADQAGYFYVDNVKSVAYDATKIATQDVNDVVEFTLNGATFKNTVKELKTYGDVTIGKTTVADYLKDLIATEADLASIRLSAPSGLRFATEIDLAKLANLTNVSIESMGTLIAPTDYIATYGALNLETYTPGTNILKVEVAKDEEGNFIYFNSQDIDGDANTTHFVGSIVNIYEQNLERDFTGRGYITVKLGNDNVYNIYSDTTCSISVADQAQKTLDAGIYEKDSVEYNTLISLGAVAAQ